MLEIEDEVLTKVYNKFEIFNKDGTVPEYFKN